MTDDLHSKGDMVRATNKETGEVREVEVRTDVYAPDYLVATSGLLFYTRNWDFEKLTPPPPTKAGLYQQYKSNYNTRHLLLTTRGKWFWIDFDGDSKNWPVAKLAPTQIVQDYAATITPIYLYGEES